MPAKPECAVPQSRTGGGATGDGRGVTGEEQAKAAPQRQHSDRRQEPARERGPHLRLSQPTKGEGEGERGQGRGEREEAKGKGKGRQRASSSRTTHSAQSLPPSFTVFTRVAIHPAPSFVETPYCPPYPPTMDVLRLKARGRSPAASGTARGGELNRDGRGASPPAPSSSNGFGGVGGASGATGTPATLAAATTSTTTSSSNDVDFHHHHHQSSPPAKQLSSPAAMTTATTATATGNALPSTTLPASVQLVEFSYPSLLSPPNPAFVAGNETRGILMKWVGD